MDKVKVPASLPPGQYVLSWRWDAEQTKQVWAHCSDVNVLPAANPNRLKKTNCSCCGTGGLIHIECCDGCNDPKCCTDPKALVTAIADVSGPGPDGSVLVDANSAATDLFRSRPRTKHVCTGGSLGLDVYECDGWVSLYDALGGDNWLGLDNHTGIVSETCSALRTDPCSCIGAWQINVVCAGVRDLLHITEIYILGHKVKGELPGAALMSFKMLTSLSLVDTDITGSLPTDLGELGQLQMLWLDHNAMLGGEVPASLGQRNMTVMELHRSNFSGVLPPLNWKDIPDCTLAGMGTPFRCPLPEGADVYCGASCE
jgi:hypothetical protein